MATIKIKDLSKELKKIIDGRFKVAKRSFGRTAANKTELAIKSRISKGQSPVEGYGRYEPYSASYKKQIKDGNVKGKRRTSPVNLRVTGKMLRSLKKRVTNNGFSIWFTSPIAKYHDDKSVARVLRKMLPDKGEKFTRDIQNGIKKSFVFWLKKTFK